MREKVTDTIKAKAIEKSLEFLKDHNNEWADHWDSVMTDEANGFDINIWQEGEDEPLSIFLYEVVGGDIDYDNELNITDEVMNPWRYNHD